MKKLILFVAVTAFVTVICITSCKHSAQGVIPVTGNFPPAVASIFLSKCATAGCHNEASYQNAAGLLLDSWAHLFQGSIHGAVAVAYSSRYSTLLYYVNTDSALGLVYYEPGHMPTPLTTAEYMTLSNWIAAGAPDNNGNIPFATNPDTRQKIYLTNQGCDVVAVIDGQTKLVMRYIPVGGGLDEAAPHDVSISSDGMYAYVPLYAGSWVQKIDTRIDTVIATANLGLVAENGTGGYWSIAMISPLDTAVMVSGWWSPGYVVTFNTTTMQVDPKSSIDVYSGGTQLFPYPHGLESNEAFDTFYTTLDYGNVVNKFWFKPSFGYEYISVNGSPTVITSNPTTPDPHQIQMSPDNSKYFVTCQNTNVVSVMDRHTDSLITMIPVGAYPQEMDVSTSSNYLFVACMDDATNPQANCIGSVYVIDMTTLQVVKVLYGNFYEPHDIAVDEQDGFLYIASRNYTGTSHHSSVCGNIGWYSVYNLSTLEPADGKQYYVTTDPYVINARF